MTMTDDEVKTLIKSMNIKKEPESFFKHLDTKTVLVIATAIGGLISGIVGTKNAMEGQDKSKKGYEVMVEQLQQSEKDIFELQKEMFEMKKILSGLPFSLEKINVVSEEGGDTDDLAEAIAKSLNVRQKNSRRAKPDPIPEKERPKASPPKPPESNIDPLQPPLQPPPPPSSGAKEMPKWDTF